MICIIIIQRAITENATAEQRSTVQRYPVNIMIKIHNLDTPMFAKSVRFPRETQRRHHDKDKQSSNPLLPTGLTF